MGNRSYLIFNQITSTEMQTVGSYGSKNRLPGLWFVLIPWNVPGTKQDLNVRIPKRRLPPYAEGDGSVWHASAADARANLARLERVLDQLDVSEIARSAIEELRQCFEQLDVDEVVIDATQYTDFGDTETIEVRSLPARWAVVLDGLERGSFTPEQLSQIRERFIGQGSSIDDYLGTFGVTDTGEIIQTIWTPLRAQADRAAEITDYASFVLWSASGNIPDPSLERTEKGMEDAVQMYRALAREKPTEYQAYLSDALEILAGVLRLRGQTDRARAIAEEAAHVDADLAASPSAEILAYSALRLERRGLQLESLAQGERNPEPLMQLALSKYTRAFLRWRATVDALRSRGDADTVFASLGPLAAAQQLAPVPFLRLHLVTTAVLGGCRDGLAEVLARVPTVTGEDVPWDQFIITTMAEALLRLASTPPAADEAVAIFANLHTAQRSSPDTQSAPSYGVMARSTLAHMVRIVAEYCNGARAHNAVRAEMKNLIPLVHGISTVSRVVDRDLIDAVCFSCHRFLATGP